MSRATSASVTESGADVSLRANERTALVSSGKPLWSPLSARNPASSCPAARRSARAYASPYSHRFARAATQRICPRSFGSRGLRARWR